MKTIKIELSREIKNLQIVPLGDLHFGSKNCKTDEFLERVEYIKNHDNVYCILGGDLIDNAIKTSVSDTYSAKYSPMEQLLKVRDMLYPIKDKIVCMVQGNHCARTLKTDGIDLCLILARELGITDRYTPATAVVFLKFGQKEKTHTTQQMLYTIMVTHGTGTSGKKMGSKANHLTDMSLISDTDVVIQFHTHSVLAFKQAFYRTNLTHCSLEECERLYVNGNAFLGYDGDYAEVLGLIPSSSSKPIISLSGVEKDMKVTF